MGLYKKVLVEELWSRIGEAPIEVKWIAVNKGDKAAPNNRRPVGKDKEEQAAGTFRRDAPPWSR